MAYTNVSAITCMGDFFAEMSLHCTSASVYQDADQTNDRQMVIMYHGTSSYSALCMIKSECLQSRIGTQGTATMTLQPVRARSNRHWPGRRFYTMFHGTTFSAAVNIIRHGFEQSADGMLGRGVYVTRDEQKALRYPLGDKTEQVVLQLKVRVGKVKKIDAQHAHMATTWHDHGYDTAWVPPNSGLPQVPSGLEEDCVWNPGRIKVIGISYAANPQHRQLLEQLLEQHSN